MSKSIVKSVADSVFCVLPFYAIELPINRVCCLIKPSLHDLDQIKKDILQGIRTQACQACWQAEDLGLKSDRQIKNETLDFYLNRDITSLIDDCRQEKNSTIHYKIDSSNTCNSTCVTCNSNSSSLWGKLEKQNGIEPSPNWSLSLDQISKNIDYKNACSIGFRGGEPLLSNTNFEILQKLIENSNTDCFINFTTNGSITLSQEQKHILEHFSNLNFNLSIDGIERVFEYMRYPLKWNQLCQNLEYFKARDFMISATFTVSNLNVLYYTDTVDWFKKNKILYHVNLIQGPRWFSVQSLPQTIKQEISKKIKDPQINLLLQKHDPMDDTNFQRFQQEIQKQDRWKNVQLKEYLPEFYQLLG